MNILFINFNIGATAGFNHGLATLSAVLKERNHQVNSLFICKELGYDFDPERMKRDILRLNPDIIGIYIMEPQFKYVEKFCADLRSYYQGFVICGGIYPTMDPETVLSVKAVDAVCIGEGEDALGELVESLETRKDFSHIRNLWVKKPGGKIVKNRLRPFKDLSTLPPEDKELFDLDKLLPLKNFQLETMLGRGCVHRCTYCCNGSYIEKHKNLCEEGFSMGGYIRMKNIDTVIKEIKNAISRHPQIRKIAFVDDNWMVFGKFVQEFCQRYKKEIGLPFVCSVHPQAFNLSKGQWLKEAGCDDVRIGVESGSERIRGDIMRRSMTTASIINAFKITKELGIMSSSFNMIGLPTETKEEVFETLKLNALLLPDTIKLMTFYPFKNTPIYDLCEKSGLIDYDKKRQLDDYQTYSCLKAAPEHQLFLKKVQAVFNWYINVILDNEASARYRKLVEAAEAMDEHEWDNFDFWAADKELSSELQKQGTPHYSKFVNRSLAVKFPSRHFLK